MTAKLIGWDSVEDVFKDFREYSQGPQPYEEEDEILLACLHSECYEESAVIIGRHKSTGNLFCIEAGHCSCYGFEGQWSPTPITVPAIRLMVANNWICRYEPEFGPAVLALCDALDGFVAGEGI